MTKTAIKPAHKAVLCIVLSIVGIVLILWLMLRPVAVFSQQKLPQALAENYLGKQFSLSDHKIHSAELISGDGAQQYIAVRFDAQPKEWAYFDWQAGNGAQGEDGWIVDKFVYIRYAELGSVYVTLDSYTGI